MSPAKSDREGVVIVRERDHGLPYSKGLMANTIMTSGLSPMRSYHVAQTIEDRLREQGREEIDTADLRKLAIEAIREEAGGRYAAAYEKWLTASSLEIPLIVLIGGATGVGKSTVATQLAARLGIVRVISTDAIREVMKSTFSREFMPTLYRSSFDSGEVVGKKSPREEEALLVGFRDQVAAVAVGVRALIDRAVNEGTDVIIEGAHVVPGFLDLDGFGGRAVIVPLMVHVDDEALHRSHFSVRAHETRSRPLERYAKYFSNIRRIQKYVKSQAMQTGTPTISNYNLDACLASVIDLVVDRAVEAAKGRGKSRVAMVQGGAQ
jgi:2-phosphoglycerate kinase